MSKHQPKNSSLAESPKSVALILLTIGSLTNLDLSESRGLALWWMGRGEEVTYPQKRGGAFRPRPVLSVLHAYHGGQISTPQSFGKMPKTLVQPDVLGQA